jgi:hypothetical protein
LVNARINDVAVTAGPDVIFNGQIRFKDTRPSYPQSMYLVSTSTIVFENGQGFEGPHFYIPTEYTPAESGQRFQIRGLMSGEYSLCPWPGGNYISSIHRDGRNAADGKIHSGDGAETNLEITLKKARAVLKISLLGQADQPNGSPLAVVVIPEGQLTATALRDRPVQCTNTKGQVVERGPYPPGAYLVFAAYCASTLDYLWPLGAQRLASTPVRVVVGEEETKAIDVTPVKPVMSKRRE